MEIVPLGDRAVLVNFEQKISPVVNEKVVRLQKVLEMSFAPEIEFMIPAFCSLTIGYSRSKTTFLKLKEKIIKLKEEEVDLKKEDPVLHKIPVCYNASYSIDIQDVIGQTNLSKNAIIELHTNQVFQVYMMGFLPGFAYLGSLPKQLFTKRKAIPRKRVENGSVGLAGFQTGIYPLESPGGWQIIGRTPVNVFDLKKEDPFFFKTNDRVQFFSISKEEFENYNSDD